MRLNKEYYQTKLGDYHRADAMHYAQYWHGGQFSELYKLSSSGEIDEIDSLIAEIEDCEKILDTVEDDTDEEELDNYSQLDCLMGYAVALKKQEQISG